MSAWAARFIVFRESALKRITLKDLATYLGSGIVADCMSGDVQEEPQTHNAFYGRRHVGSKSVFQSRHLRRIHVKASTQPFSQAWEFAKPSCLMRLLPVLWTGIQLEGISSKRSRLGVETLGFRIYGV